MWLVLCLLLLGWGSLAVAAPVSITTATDLQAAITANPVGTVFLLQAGTHRRGSLTPKDGNVFLGAAGAILSGGEILTGWTASGSDWFVGGQTQQGTVLNPLQCETGFEQCANPEDVFYDDVPLIGVANQAALAPGKFYFDYAADRIYIRDNPSGHTVETSVRTNAFTGTAQNVTIRNLTIEKYATPLQRAAIAMSTSSHGWTIESCVIRHNHSWGVQVTGNRWTLRGNTLSINGQLGLAGTGKNLLIEANTISDNNYAHVNQNWEAGGAKITHSRAVRFLRNQVHTNLGGGLWCDINCVDIVYAHNTVTGNNGQGLHHEISYHAVMRHNTSLDNGNSTPNWLFGAQINVANSERVEVYGNVTRQQAIGSGITLTQQDRGVGMWGTYVPRSNSVHRNTIRHISGTGIAGFNGAGDDFGEIEERGNEWDYNVVFINPTLNRFVWYPCSPAANYATFLSCGHDVHGVRYDP